MRLLEPELAELSPFEGVAGVVGCGVSTADKSPRRAVVLRSGMLAPFACAMVGLVFSAQRCVCVVSFLMPSFCAGNSGTLIERKKGFLPMRLVVVRCAPSIAKQSE